MRSLAPSSACHGASCSLRTAHRACSARVIRRPRCAAVRVVAEKDAKQRQAADGEGPARLAPAEPSAEPRAASSQSESSASSGGVATTDDGPPLVVRLLGLIAAVMAVISIFYSIVFYAGAGLFYLVGDNVTFTRKDFIPYSERRALEKEAEEAQFAREASASQKELPAAPDTKFSESFLPDSGKKQ